MDQGRTQRIVAVAVLLFFLVGLPITRTEGDRSEILPYTPKPDNRLTETVALSAVLAPENVAPVVTMPATIAPRPTATGRASRSVRIGTGRTVVSTAYCLHGTMANGKSVHTGAVAMNGVKLGTQFKDIQTGEVFTVEDRIGHGSDFDIWMSSCAAAVRYGRRTRTIVPIN